jgi:aspartyl-tRNA(Asn)/glutamyl-tRNA(Gln) amidotransferase subunit A
VTSRRSFILGVCSATVLSADADPALMTLAAASERVRKKTISPVELTQACLRRIERLNPLLNAYITVTGEAALAKARELEAEAQRGHWRGPLHGIPVSLKDNIDTAGVRTTAASGPGAAIAARLCFGSLGTDTAGSIRTPAAYCGVVGLKPTYGRVSNRGTVPDSWTMDHVGPLCRTAEDAALLLGVIAGYDEFDPASMDKPVPDYGRAFRMPVSKLRLGIPRVPFF